MRKMKYALVFALVAMSLVSIAAGKNGLLPSEHVLAEEQAAWTSQAMPNASQQAYVYFAHSMKIEKALDEATSYQLQVVELRHSIHAIDQDIQGGYFLQPDLSPQENARQYEQACGESIASIVQQVEDAIVTATDAKTQTAWRHQLAILARVQAQLRESGVKVTSMRVEGEANSISELATRSPLVSSVQLAPSSERTIESSEAQSALAVDPNTWLPSEGSIYVHPWGEGTDRYVTQWMQWSNVSGFASNSAYEHDFFLNNYDGKTYFSRAQSIDSVPTVVSWGSNLPNAYLDTRFGDPAEEVAYVVGCANGDAIQPDTAYWSQIRVAKGDADTDTAKLFGQLGHRSPSFCYSTWCVFADQTEVILGAWDISIPGDREWSR